MKAGLDQGCYFTFPAWFWDYDNDGWPDIFLFADIFLMVPLAKVAAAEALNKPLGNVSKMYLYHNNHDGSIYQCIDGTRVDQARFCNGFQFWRYRQ